MHLFLVLVATIVFNSFLLLLVRHLLLEAMHLFLVLVANIVFNSFLLLLVRHLLLEAMHLFLVLVANIVFNSFLLLLVRHLLLEAMHLFLVSENYRATSQTLNNPVREPGNRPVYPSMFVGVRGSPGCFKHHLETEDMFVGGISTAGEEPRRTAWREVAEELGLTRGEGEIKWAMGQGHLFRLCK